MGEEFDAGSLVDAVFGAAKPGERETETTAEIEAETKADVAGADAEAAADAESVPDAEAAQNQGSALGKRKRKPKAGKVFVAEASADGEPEAEAGASSEAVPAAVGAESGAEAESDAASESKVNQGTGLRKSLTRGRIAAAAAVVLGVAAASVLLLSGGSSGNAATPSATSSTEPSVNPQAFYPVQSASPYETGAKSALSDAALQAAVPGCGGCKLVTRANGFSPDGAVLALFRTGAPQVGKANFKLVVVDADGRLVWSAPEGVKALTAGIERFSVDGAGNFYLALPGAKSGQILVVLAWRDGKVQDIGGLLDPKIKSDSIVGVPKQASAGAATIVSQTTAGVPDADTGGLVESQYQIKDGRPVLVGCRRHVGESGQWIPFQPSADGCTHWPAGPVGPPEDDDPTKP